MFGWVVTFLIVALIAGILGFGGIAGASIEIAKAIFVIALILFLIGRLRAAGIRSWLLVVNLAFFIIQLVLLIINYHPQ